ncbi:MAG: molybdopterin-guanine dinucleotide biosynthesis protein B [Candidatus Hodarchaeota archaeon]
MKIISLFGYSGSGKTHIIKIFIKKLKEQLNYEIAVIKNVHKHKIDEEGKDSFLFSQAGANYSIIKNQINEYAIFFKTDMNIEDLIKWIEDGPLKVDLIIIEGFRDLSYPAILCVKNFSEIEPQLSSNVKMISGLIVKQVNKLEYKNKIPIVDISKEFQTFLEIFDISQKDE